MRILSTGVAIAALIALAACTGSNGRPTDTGNMQTPSYGTSGAGISTTAPARPDVGSMSAPSGTGGAVTRTTRSPGPDTGSMALPSAAQGNSVPHTSQ